MMQASRSGRERELFKKRKRDARAASAQRQPQPQVKVQLSTPVDDMNRVRELLVDKLGSENGLLRSALAEFIGTFFLIFIGLSANIQYKVTDSPMTSVQLAWGFGFAFAVYLAANVSGAHINPAISIAALVNGGLSFLRFFIYLFSQIIGAFVGAAAAYLGHIDDMNYLQQREDSLIGGNTTSALFATFPSSHMTVYGSLVDQIMGTAILALCIELIVDKRHRIHSGLIPLLAGFAMAMISMTYGTNGGFAINPARDLGPRLFLLCVGYGWELFTANNYYFWIPIVGPIIGAIIGSWVYKLFIGIHGLNEDIPISKPQKSDSTKSLIEPQTLSWRQTTIPPFPPPNPVYSKPVEPNDPARQPSFFSDIRRDFEHRQVDEKFMDLNAEDSFKRTRAPSPPPSHEPPPPPVSSPAGEPENLRKLFETDRPVPFYRSVFEEKKENGPLPTIHEAQKKMPETASGFRPWERDADRFSSAPASEASVPSQRAPPPPQAPPRLRQQPGPSSYQRTDRDQIQVSLAYYRND
ncbi:unnamed protein product [Bursaphelenchus okinawaensis]|uniref:Uncharacterized protein n=1 Tax=Bursaphelenchus okinawaensis TaxID=465554 RepID=A0A811LNV2_9BILA|nr:unnamed protein product [Bursaphelenchus okinawaensis]CAG9124651.1 unnamed protein product [Bursaphelenchus okinawaensis]